MNILARVSLQFLPATACVLRTVATRRPVFWPYTFRRTVSFCRAKSRQSASEGRGDQQFGAHQCGVPVVLGHFIQRAKPRHGVNMGLATPQGGVQ